MINIPDDLSVTDPLSELPFQTQAQVLSDLISSCISAEYRQYAYEIDTLIARTLSKRPELCAIPDSEGNLILWQAINFSMTRTLQTLVELDQSPRKNNRLIASCSKTNQHHRFITCELLKTMSCMNESIKTTALRIMHSLVPILTKEDSENTAGCFLAEIVNSKNLNLLQKLINEGYDLLTPLSPDPALFLPKENFIDLVFRGMLWNFSFKTIQFLQIKGMVYTNSLLRGLRNHTQTQSNVAEMNVLLQFIKTVESISIESPPTLRHFICNVNMLRAYGIDIRDSLFYNTKSAENLLEACQGDTREHRKFLRERPPLDRGSQYSYLLRLVQPTENQRLTTDLSPSHHPSPQ